MLLKIVKHCKENLPTPVTGQLLGLDVDGRIEVTDAFPSPSTSDEPEDESECELLCPSSSGYKQRSARWNLHLWELSHYLLTFAVSPFLGSAYQVEMLKCLRAVNVDNNTVGWYQVCALLRVRCTCFPLCRCISSASSLLLPSVCQWFCGFSLSLPPSLLDGASSIFCTFFSFFPTETIPHCMVFFVFLILSFFLSLSLE